MRRGWLVILLFCTALHAGCATTGRANIRPLQRERVVRSVPQVEVVRAAATLAVVIATEKRLDGFQKGLVDEAAVQPLRLALEEAITDWPLADREVLLSQAMILMAEVNLALLAGPPVSGRASVQTVRLRGDAPALAANPGAVALAEHFNQAELDAASHEVVTRLLGRLDETEKRVLARAAEAARDTAPSSWKVAWPVKKPVITSKFGMRRDPLKKREKRMHRGVDLRGAKGDAVLAAGPGEVLLAGWAGRGTGNAVVIRHPGGIVTQYFHLSKVRTTAGATVSVGDVIGEVGATGRATGPHLHFMLSVSGEAVDPVPWIGKKVSP